jgi:hypothetical protein
VILSRPPGLKFAETLSIRNLATRRRYSRNLLYLFINESSHELGVHRWRQRVGHPGRYGAASRIYRKMYNSIDGRRSVAHQMGGNVT